MGATTVKPPEHPIAPDNSAKISIATPPARNPVRLDYFLFFLGIPLAIAFLFSLVGTRLTNGMPYFDGLLYMTLHMLTAWLPVTLGAYIVKLSCRSWRPPLIAVCLIGLLVALVPTAYLFEKLGELYASLYPLYAANRADAALPSWSLEYLLHFLRDSMPILPLFLAGVYGYRFVTGVDWFGYSSPGQLVVKDIEESRHEIKPKNDRATAKLIKGTQLPDNAELLAIKAEQHYIQIWSDQGTDMVRYRFRDLSEILSDCNGTQVHRSWWVNLDHVNSCKKAGRKLELLVGDELTIPVSLSHKNVVLNILNQQAK